MVNRKNYAKIKECFDFPNLIRIQLASYEHYLQSGVTRNKRQNVGLEGLFRDMLPIETADKSYALEYMSYTLGKPKYSIPECLKTGMTFAGALRVRLRLKTPKDTKEQEVYLCDMPLMTPTGTFIINGDERVVVSQLHRSPGISFEESLHPSGKRLFSARIIPYRGAWVEFEFDPSDILYVYLDRRRKFVASVLLRIFGLSKDEDILRAFSGVEKVKITRESQLADYMNFVLAEDIVDDVANTILAKSGERITKDVAKRIWYSKTREFFILSEELPEIVKTVERDTTRSKEEALLDIYRKLRPGDPPTLDSATGLTDRLFFDCKRYSVGKVGRFMLNRKLSMDMSHDNTTLDSETLIRAIKKLIKIKNAGGPTDDIDHLGNRRVRSVGELLLNQLRIGMVRLERSVRERMNIYDLDSVMPHNLINAKLISSIVKDFFGRSQLSQFMDQTNPLAELTHKRRLSALGPGGLNRERAGFEVRDVHYSHYGRMCPIETPEGPNIGLITSLSTYAIVNEYGFLETPYRRVENGRVTNKIEYLSADIEDEYIIAQANERVDKSDLFINERVFCRYKRDFISAEHKNVQYMDVSPCQLVSVAAALIPFLEHDDANRALMGSNMQRQAVPLLNTEAPLIGTGMEYRTAKDSGAVVVSRSKGTVTYVDGKEIAIGGKKHSLRKFERSNANTSINQRPIVKVGQKVKEGDVIADGAATRNGELALGKNVLVAFMPWRGYNFEDAILVSERLLKNDTFTSVHIEEFEIDARDTRLGNEEITRDIPNVGEEALRNLDTSGIVRIGAEVVAGDILVGKVTPKSETELSPEEKLLRAIFGEKAGDVRDASLTVPPGIEGLVVDVKVFARKEARSKTKEERASEFKEIKKIEEFYSAQIKKMVDEKARKLHKLLVGQKLSASLLDIESGKILIKHDAIVRAKDLGKVERADLAIIKVAENTQLENEIHRVTRLLDGQIEELTYEQEREIDRVKRGDELPPGVLKKVVVYVASKKRLSVGDKMAGRHGNKGVIAKVLPEEDMPFLKDGTPVEIVLNPLGVPSRMNVGQILETHLGWAAKVLGFQVASPVFDGARENEIKKEMKAAKIPEDGKVTLFDGLTGKAFDQKITVGFIYIMKLVHLVDDKIHARSIGPYSLVTQQPLGGKAQFGGQRFGEMEVWALEAYGAAYALQELLTVKSDDVSGRTKIYEAIVKGESDFQPGTPESFNVLVKELQALCLDVRMERLGGSNEISESKMDAKGEK
ncbi:MAG: DNA-directed RNA polymerase subunit beta [Candidatus Omnitrophota bacterium]